MALRNGDGATSMLDNLKSRLGFNRNDDDFYDDDAFDDDEYTDEYDDEYEGYGSDYDESAPVGAYRPAGSHNYRSTRFGRADSAASNLVSIEDVKAHTRIPDRLQRDPLAPQDNAYDSYQGSAATPARSEGLDSLFEPSNEPTFTPFDPYEAYSNQSSSPYTTTRPLTVIKPVIYGDVEKVARAVKSGDVVVLAMRNTPDDLSKRILDFAFGVASALDANVECPGDKVFAIARGSALTEDEKTRLRNQGAL